MMLIEQQVCHVERTKWFKELGVKREKPWSGWR